MRNLLLVPLVLFLSSCAPAKYTEADLTAQYARFTEGIVVKQSLGSFILKDQAGEEMLFRTGELTQYIPENYRSLKGDTVKVAYKEIRQTYGREKRAVLQLHSVTVAPQNLPLANPLTGKIVDIGRGSMTHFASIIVKPDNSDLVFQVYILVNSKVMLDDKPFFNGTVDPEWSRLKGYFAKVEVERVPVLRGNGYIYQTSNIVVRKNM